LTRRRSGLLPYRTTRRPVACRQCRSHSPIAGRSPALEPAGTAWITAGVMSGGGVVAEGERRHRLLGSWRLSPGPGRGHPWCRRCWLSLAAWRV
jgi:hypothetical protein